MTSVSHIRVQHIRTHSNYAIDTSPTVTVITGPNGAGKTSLIEALYIALQGVSFRSSDKDIVRQGAVWYRIDITFRDGGSRTVKFEPEKTAGRKQFIIDDKTYYRLGLQHKYPVVLFEPDDLRLLNGSPSRRRQFLDRLIAQIDPRYGTALRRYERALKQRNTLLKRPHVTSDDLFAWNVTLSEYGAYIIKQRLYIIEEITRELQEIYRTISGAEDNVTVHYSHSHADTQQKLLTDLHTHTEKDRILGFTSVGPHRHDSIFTFNGALALGTASRGEIRSIILALKFLEVHLTERLTGKKPIILLDDVFSELDETRQKNLMTEFTDHQIIITSVGSIAVPSAKMIALD